MNTILEAVLIISYGTLAKVDLHAHHINAFCVLKLLWNSIEPSSLQNVASFKLFLWLLLALILLIILFLILLNLVLNSVTTIEQVALINNRVVL